MLVTDAGTTNCASLCQCCLCDVQGHSVSLCSPRSCGHGFTLSACPLSSTDSLVHYCIVFHNKDISLSDIKCYKWWIFYRVSCKHTIMKLRAWTTEHPRLTEIVWNTSVMTLSIEIWNASIIVLDMLFKWRISARYIRFLT